MSLQKIQTFSVYKNNCSTDTNTTSNFLKHLRNAIAHCRIDPKGDTDITTITFRDQNREENPTKTWEVTLSVEQLDSLTQEVSDKFLAAQEG